MIGHRALEKKQITQGNNRKVQNPSGSLKTKEKVKQIPDNQALSGISFFWQIAENSRFKGSVVILGGLSFVNSLHAYTFASLKRKKLISTTPLNDALNALILALNASAAAFVLLFTKKFKIGSV